MSGLNESNFNIKFCVAAGEIVILNALLYLFLSVFPGFVILSESSNFDDIKLRLLFFIVNLSYLLSLSWVGIVLDRRSVFAEKILQKVFKLSLSLFFIVFAGLYIVKFYAPIKLLGLFCLIVMVCFSVWRLLARFMLKTYRGKGGNKSKVLVLGAGTVANELYNHLISNITYGYQFMGFFDDREPKDYKVESELVKGKLADVEKFIAENGVQEIFCALPAGDDRKALPIVKYAENNCVRCYIVPDFKRFIYKKVNLSFFEDIPVVSLINEPLTLWQNRFLKRAFDFIVALIFTCTVFPFLYLILGIAIKLSSPGPIFFKQKRTGENGEDFLCYKFRTMQVNKDADKVQATKNDARVTKIGAFMRKTNLDEMPQFLNVLIGNMSLVGPRPHMLKHTEMYSSLIDKYMLRHLAKPGITGWAQVTGFRGETRTVEEMAGRVKQDVWYIENWSFFLDLKIMYLTVYNMIHGDKQAY